LRHGPPQRSPGHLATEFGYYVSTEGAYRRSGDLERDAGIMKPDEERDLVIAPKCREGTQRLRES
jgi:hypothetical protein